MKQLLIALSLLTITSPALAIVCEGTVDDLRINSNGGVSATGSFVESSYAAICSLNERGMYDNLSPGLCSSILSSLMAAKMSGTTVKFNLSATTCSYYSYYYGDILDMSVE